MREPPLPAALLLLSRCGDTPSEQELTPFPPPSSQVQEEGPRQQALHHPPHVQRPHAVPQALCQLQRGEDHQGACRLAALSRAASALPGPARSPCRAGAQGRAFPCDAQVSRTVPSRTVVVPASPPASAWAWGVPGAEGQGFPERKCDWPRGARPPRPALCVSQVQFRAAASRGAQVGSALLAQWPLNRRLVSQRSGDLFSGAGASFCGLGQGACRSLRFPTGRGAGWLGSAFFQTRAPQGVGAASGNKVLHARRSSGTGKPRFSGFRCGPSQSLCLSVPRLDLPEGSVSWRIFKRNCLESHSFFAFSNS